MICLLIRWYLVTISLIKKKQYHNKDCMICFNIPMFGSKTNLEKHKYKMVRSLNVVKISNNHVKN